MPYLLLLLIADRKYSLLVWPRVEVRFAAGIMLKILVKNGFIDFLNNKLNIFKEQSWLNLISKIVLGAGILQVPK